MNAAVFAASGEFEGAAHPGEVLCTIVHFALSTHVLCRFSDLSATSNLLGPCHRKPVDEGSKTAEERVPPE